MKLIVILFALLSSTKALTFNCEFSEREIPTIFLPPLYACHLTIIEDISDSEFLTGVNGIHLEERTNADVKFLDIHNVTDLQFIPKGIGNFFPNLEALHFLSCNLTELRGDELQPFPKISWLRLVGNLHLEIIPGNLFKNKPQMEVICLSSNGINNVGIGLLDGLINLRHVDFLFNKCINKLVENDNSLSEAELNELKVDLQINCSDFQVGPPPLICADFNQTICQLQEQNRIMKEQNEATKELIERMTIKLEDLTEKSEKMEEELDEILDSFEEGVSCAVN